MAAFAANYLGSAPAWYKRAITGFLLLNPLLLLTLGPVVTGWMLIGEFIFTLAMALKCYPLQPGGLLALEAVLLGLTSPHGVYQETLNNFEVILLLMFMVAGIYFMKDLLLYVFTPYFTECPLQAAVGSPVLRGFGRVVRFPRRPDRHRCADQCRSRFLYRVSPGRLRQKPRR